MMVKNIGANVSKQDVRHRTCREEGHSTDNKDWRNVSYKGHAKLTSSGKRKK